MDDDMIEIGGGASLEVTEEDINHTTSISGTKQNDASDERSSTTNHEMASRAVLPPDLPSGGLDGLRHSNAPGSRESTIAIGSRKPTSKSASPSSRRPPKADASAKDDAAAEKANAGDMANGSGSAEQLLTPRRIAHAHSSDPTLPGALPPTASESSAAASAGSSVGPESRASASLGARRASISGGRRVSKTPSLASLVGLATKAGRKSKWGSKSKKAKASILEEGLEEEEEGKSTTEGVASKATEPTVERRRPAAILKPAPTQAQDVRLATQERGELWRAARTEGRHHQLGPNPGASQAEDSASPRGGCFTRPASVLMASAHAPPPTPAKVYDPQPPPSKPPPLRTAAKEFSSEFIPPKTAPQCGPEAARRGTALWPIYPDEEASAIAPPATAGGGFRAAPAPVIALPPPERPRISLGPIEHRGGAEVWVNQDSPQHERSPLCSAPWAGGRTSFASHVETSRQVAQVPSTHPPKTSPGKLELVQRVDRQLSPRIAQQQRPLNSLFAAPSASFVATGGSNPFPSRGSTATESRTFRITHHTSTLAAEPDGGSPPPPPTPELRTNAGRRTRVKRYSDDAHATFDTTSTYIVPRTAPVKEVLNASAPFAMPPAYVPLGSPPPLPPRSTGPFSSMLPIPTPMSLPPPGTGGALPPPPTAHELLGSLAQGSLSARVFVAAMSTSGHGRNISTTSRSRPPAKPGTLASLLRSTEIEASLEAVWTARLADQVAATEAGISGSATSSHVREMPRPPTAAEMAMGASVAASLLKAQMERETRAQARVARLDACAHDMITGHTHRQSTHIHPGGSISARGLSSRETPPGAVNKAFNANTFEEMAQRRALYRSHLERQVRDRDDDYLSIIGSVVNEFEPPRRQHGSQMLRIPSPPPSAIRSLRASRTVTRDETRILAQQQHAA